MRPAFGSIINTLLFNFHSGAAISFDWHQVEEAEESEEEADGAQCFPSRQGGPLRVRMGIITHEASALPFSQWLPL